MLLSSFVLVNPFLVTFPLEGFLLKGKGGREQATFLKEARSISWTLGTVAPRLVKPPSLNVLFISLLAKQEMN